MLVSTVRQIYIDRTYMYNYDWMVTFPGSLQTVVMHVNGKTSWMVYGRVIEPLQNTVKLIEKLPTHSDFKVAQPVKPLIY